MKRYNIVVPKKYTSNGEEKTQWNTVGSLVYFPANNGKDEGFALDLHMFPNTPIKVFEQKPREDRGGYSQAPQQPRQQSVSSQMPSEEGYDVVEYPDEDINPEDIPF